MPGQRTEVFHRLGHAGIVLVDQVHRILDRRGQHRGIVGQVNRGGGQVVGQPAIAVPRLFQRALAVEQIGLHRLDPGLDPADIGAGGQAQILLHRHHFQDLLRRGQLCLGQRDQFLLLQYAEIGVGDVIADRFDLFARGPFGAAPGRASAADVVDRDAEIPQVLGQRGGAFQPPFDRARGVPGTRDFAPAPRTDIQMRQIGGARLVHGELRVILLGQRDLDFGVVLQRANNRGAQRFHRIGRGFVARGGHRFGGGRRIARLLRW